jgi:hypothetical protein
MQVPLQAEKGANEPFYRLLRSRRSTLCIPHPHIDGRNEMEAGREEKEK